MLALLYPLDSEIKGYTREQFLSDLVDQCEKDIRGAFKAGAKRVSIDFTEGRLACRNDRNNPWTGRKMLSAVHRPQQPGARSLQRRGAQEHRHPHLPRRRLRRDPQRRRRLCRAPAQHVQDERRLFPNAIVERKGQGTRVQARAGDTAAQTPTAWRRSASSASSTRRIRASRSPEEVRDALMEASKYIPKERLGSTDDCGFSPFSIDVKPKHGSPDVARDIAFQKITSRVKERRWRPRSWAWRRSALRPGWGAAGTPPAPPPLSAIAPGAIPRARPSREREFCFYTVGCWLGNSALRASWPALCRPIHAARPRRSLSSKDSVLLRYLS